jgi:hypothetical protein
MRGTEYLGEGGECLLCGMLAPRLTCDSICETCDEMITEDVERRLVRMNERFPDKPRRRRK